MTEHPTLAGLDEIDWSALSHAYGSAEDIPDLLRRLAGAGSAANKAGEAYGIDETDDAGEAANDADEIIGDLWSSICHQGSVYSASVAAAPFLAQIAAAGVATVAALHLLGSIAQAADPREVGDAEPVRAAVAACFDLLAPLLESPDVDIRAAAIFVLAHSGPAERVRPLLVALWNAGADPALRTVVLHALIRVDSDLAADLASEVLDAGPENGESDASLRVSAAYTWIHAGRGLNDRVLAAALAPVADNSPDLSTWSAEGELFDLIVGAMAEHHGVRTAADFLAMALIQAQDGPDAVAEQWLGAARNLVVAYRGAAEPLIEPITGLLSNPALNSPVFGLLSTIGPAAYSSQVREHLIALSEGSDAFADQALCHLFSFGDPLAPTLLARHLADRPRALGIAAGAAVGPEPGDIAVPFDAGLLAAIGRRLAELADGAGQRAPKGEDLFASVRRTNEPNQLARILGGWGPAAASAATDLAGILPIGTIPAARALAAILPQGPESEDVSAALRETLGQKDVAAAARIAVAEAIRAITGDPEPLLDTVLTCLDHFSGPDNPTGRTRDDDQLRAAATAAADLPAHADTLVPRLTRALLDAPPTGPSLPAHSSRIHLVSTLYQLTGESMLAIPVLRESLSLVGEFYTGWTVAAAADAAAALGGDARDLLSTIELALDDPIACPAAAQALLTIDPDGEWANGKRDQLAHHLIQTLTHRGAAVAQRRALDVLETFGATLPTTAAEVLRRLADGDERIVAALSDAELVRADENACRRIRALLDRQEQGGAEGEGVRAEANAGRSVPGQPG